MLLLTKTAKAPTARLIMSVTNSQQLNRKAIMLQRTLLGISQLTLSATFLGFTFITPHNQAQAQSVSRSHTTIKTFSAGTFPTGWTHTVNTANGIFYYNAETGSGGLGRLDSNGNFTYVKTYPKGFFTIGWTHIVNTPNGILYYKSDTGAVSIGVIDSAGNFTNAVSYPSGSFSTGWTNIINTPNGIFYYNSQRGSAAVGRIIIE
jgi:glucan-binding YG repeat protein